MDSCIKVNINFFKINPIMKYFKIHTILLLSSVLFFYGCNDKSKTPKQDTAKPVEVSDTPKPTNSNTTKEPAQNASGVWHYTCRMGCSGGDGSAVNCKTCGIVLAHNTAYHGKTNSTTDNSPFATPNPTTTPEPAQNAAGVWHYTCTQGHTGGAGSAVACKSCNTTLTHNTAYH